MARGDEFRKAYGGLVEARSLQNYRDAYTENSKTKRIMDNYNAKMKHFVAYTKYLTDNPKHLIDGKPGNYTIDDGAGKITDISDKVYKNYERENKEIDDNVAKFKSGYDGYATSKPIVKVNKNGEATIGGKTVEQVTAETDEKITEELVKEETKKLTASPDLKPSVRTAGMTLDKNNMIGTNYAKIKGTDQYYDLNTGNKVSEGDALRDTPQGRRVMEQYNAMQSLPENPTLGAMPGNYGMSLGSTTKDTVDEFIGYDPNMFEGMDVNEVKRLRDEGINDASSIEDKLNYKRFNLDKPYMGKSTNYDSTVSSMRDPNQVSPFGRTRALALSKKATELGLEGRGLRKYKNPNTQKVSLLDPQMGVTVSPDMESKSGGLTVGSMTGVPTGLQEMTGGTLTSNANVKTSPQNEKAVDRLVAHYAKYGSPIEKTGFYKDGFNELTATTPESRIASHQAIQGYKRALLGYGSKLKAGAKRLQDKVNRNLPSIPDDGYANPYFPK